MEKRNFREECQIKLVDRARISGIFNQSQRTEEAHMARWFTAPDTELSLYPIRIVTDAGDEKLIRSEAEFWQKTAGTTFRITEFRVKDSVPLAMAA